MTTLRDRLAEAWEKQIPHCLSCDWANSFHEIAEDLEATGEPGEYWAPCRSKDADDADTHRGYFVYLESE